MFCPVLSTHGIRFLSDEIDNKADFDLKDYISKEVAVNVEV